MNRHGPHPVAVVGKGLIGSAAARHLAEAGLGPVLIGPDEPSDPRNHGGVFASHHDAARITRALDRDPVWARLARESMARHPELEAASGVRFHHPHPVLFAAGDSDLIDALAATAAADPDLAPIEAADGHPQLALPADARLCREQGAAGWIAPRALVHAQTLAAVAAGARVIRQPVWALRAHDDGVRLILDDGGEVLAERVLVCAGAFSGPVGLVSGLPLTAEGRSVLLARVEPDRLDALADLPCLILDGTGTDPGELYLMPPIRYPDGHHYLKLGTGAWRHPLDDLEALQQWFRLPPPGDDVERLAATLARLVPALADAPLGFDRCAVTSTPSGRPLIGWTEGDRVAVACGGNGRAAKSSDEIGRLAAALVAGTADPAELAPFRP